MLWPKKRSDKEFDNEKKIPAARKFPTPHFLMGRPMALSDGEVDLGAHSVFPTPHPQKVTVTYVSITRYSSGKKHVEGFPEQFLNCLRRYVGKHVAS